MIASIKEVPPVPVPPKSELALVMSREEERILYDMLRRILGKGLDRGGRGQMSLTPLEITFLEQVYAAFK